MTAFNQQVFIIENEEETLYFDCIDEYLDALHGKNVLSKAQKQWEDWSEVAPLYEEEDVEDDWDLGGELFTARISAQLTQKQLAKKIGLSVCTIARLEKGVFPRVKGERIYVRKKTRGIVQKFVSEYL